MRIPIGLFRVMFRLFVAFAIRADLVKANINVPRVWA